MIDGGPGPLAPAGQTEPGAGIDPVIMGWRVKAPSPPRRKSGPGSRSLKAPRTGGRTGALIGREEAKLRPIVRQQLLNCGPTFPRMLLCQTDVSEIGRNAEIQTEIEIWGFQSFGTMKPINIASHSPFTGVELETVH